MSNLVKIINDPFRRRCITYEWQPGETIRDILDHVDIDLHDCAVVAINGHVISGEYFHVLRPKPGMLITAYAVPQKKGDIFRTIASIAVVVGAAYTGGALFGAAGTFGAGATGGALGTNALGAALVTAGVTAVGMLVVNSLIPVNTDIHAPDPISQSQSLSIDAAHNRIRPFGVCPMVLGYMRIYPDMASLPYTTYDDGDQRVHMLFWMSYKDLRVYKATAKLGDTLLTSYTDYDIQYDTGGNNDETITLYKKDRVETAVSLPLDVGAANRITQTTAADAQESRVDIMWLNGLIYYDDDGDAHPAFQEITIQWRVSGATAWITAEIFRTAAETRDTIRKTRLIEFPQPGQYDISMYVSDAYRTDNVLSNGEPWDGGILFDQSTWTIIRSVQPGVPVKYANAALAALRIKATDQVSGTPDIYNVECQTKTADWDAALGIWKTKNNGTNNPAALLRRVLTDAITNDRAMATTRLDATSFQEFWTWCDTMNFAFNMYIDYEATVQQVKDMITSAGRAACYEVDGTWIVKIDKKQTQIHQYLSPRNTMGYTANRIYPDELHAFRIQFVSEEEGWANSERIVYKDGYNADGSGGKIAATKFEALDMPGVTNPEQLWYLARYRHKCAELQQENFAIKLDVENLYSLPGDRIAWQEDSLLIGIGASRVKSYSGGVMVVDADFVFDNTQADGYYGFTVRLSDGTAETFGVDTNLVVSPNNTFTVNGTPVFAADDLAIFGVVGEITTDLLIKDIVQGPDMTATLICLPYSDNLYPEENGDVAPVYDPVITTPPDKGTPTIESIISDYSVDGMKINIGSTGNTDTVQWLRFEYRVTLVDDITGLPTGEPSDTPWILTLLDPETSSYTVSAVVADVYYTVRLSYTYTDGTIGGYVEEDHLVVGGDNPAYPGNVLAVTTALTLTTYQAAIT